MEGMVGKIVGWALVVSLGCFVVSVWWRGLRDEAADRAAASSRDNVVTGFGPR